MSDSLLEIIVGYSSATLVSLLNLPQAIKVYKLKSSDLLSSMSLALHLGNSMLWLWYGSLLGQAPILIANSSYLLTNLVLVGFKLRFKSKVGLTHE